ncbi:hypothetical protein D3C80_852220 [compost metagenome]
MSACVELLPSNETEVGQATVLSTNSMEGTLGSSTVMVMVVELLHEPIVPLIAYVVVTVGFAVTLFPVVADNPVPGVQVMELAPDAVKEVLAPLQIRLFPETLIVGVGFTVMATNAESKSEHPPPIVYKMAL